MTLDSGSKEARRRVAYHSQYGRAYPMKFFGMAIRKLVSRRLEHIDEEAVNIRLLLPTRSAISAWANCRQFNAKVEIFDVRSRKICSRKERVLRRTCAAWRDGAAMAYHASSITSPVIRLRYSRPGPCRPREMNDTLHL